jgi:hypothetical protein
MQAKPPEKTGGSTARLGSNRQSLREQAGLLNLSKSDKIKATLKAKAEKFKSQTIKVDENWSVVRVDELNWQIRHKEQRAPFDRWFFGTLREAILCLPDKMLGEEAKGTVDDVRRCHRAFCETVINAAVTRFSNTEPPHSDEQRTTH